MREQFHKGMIAHSLLGSHMQWHTQVQQHGAFPVNIYMGNVIESKIMITTIHSTFNVTINGI